MKAVNDRSTSRPSSAKLPASGLRTGKIHATKNSASQIRRMIGVTLADERIAERALTIAAMGRKAKPTAAAKKVTKQDRPVTTKKR